MRTAAHHPQVQLVARQVSDSIECLRLGARDFASLRAAVYAVCPYEDEARDSLWRQLAVTQLAAISFGIWTPLR
jgi:hypothetical protein